MAAVEPSDSNINHHTALFNAAVLKAAKTAIPRGRRRNYQPNWSPKLAALYKELEKARDEMEHLPTNENVMAHNKARALFTQEKLKATRTSWHEKTASLNMEKDMTGLWNLTRALNNDNPRRAKPVVEVDSQLKTEKMAANAFAELYREVSNTHLCRERTKQVREQTRNILLSDKRKHDNSVMTEPFSMRELNDALQKLKPKKAPGSDGITAEMLKHLGAPAKETLLEIFNKSWRTGIVPAVWKEAEIVPILKKGKDKRDPHNYRPISLLSCVGKLMERMVNRRLISHLEKNNILSSTQTGYRKFRSTEDQLAYLAQDIENAFQEKKKLLAVFFDLSRAFDKVWKEGLILKLLQTGVRKNMHMWIHHYLFARTARVKLDGHLSKKVCLKEGVPQGGVLSPTLFLVYINDVLATIPRQVSNTLHADDLAIWTASEHTGTATYRIQQAVNNIDQWTQDWGFEVNNTKTQATLFSLSTSKEQINLRLKDQALPQTDTPSFLGVKLDARLTWKPQI